MTNREKAIVMAFTGVCMLTGDNLKHYYDYCSELLGHPAYTHEIYTEQIQELSKPDFIKLCAETTDNDPVKHGHWVRDYCERPRLLDTDVCSECGTHIPCDINFKYCPYCGAKMDEVSE